MNMNKNRLHHLLASAALIFGLLAYASANATAAPPKGNHHNGKQMLGDKIKPTGCT